MAVRAHCENCKKSFTAQDEYLGKKIKCPSCGTKVEVLSEDDQRAKDEWRREQEQKLQLLEQMDERARQRSGGSYATEFGTGIDPVRNFNPGAVTRFRKLRALSSFLLLSAYLITILVLAASGIVVALYVNGTITNPWVLSIALLGTALVLVLSFACFKFLGELSWLLADLGDHQLDVRNLLLDLRDDFDRAKPRSRPNRERTTADDSAR